jgi:hypothetical protein
MTSPPVTTATERLQTAVHLFLTAMGYAPRQTWAVGEFLFVSFREEATAEQACRAFEYTRLVREAELKHEPQGPYIVVRY